MDTTKTVNVGIKDLYQFLISECRYGYTRNNHLMPSCAYDHARKYLDLLLKEDRDFALYAASQLFDECISFINFSFDEKETNADFVLKNNKKDSIDFIKYLLNFIIINSGPGDASHLPNSLDKYYEITKE